MQLLFVILYVLSFHYTILSKFTKLTIDRVNSIKSLQAASNGFDLRGCVVESTEGPLLSNESAFWIGVGFAEYLKELNRDKPIKIGLGRDSRLSGIDLSNWLASGIESCGCKAYYTGICTTPSMYLSCSSELLSKISKTIYSNDNPWPFDGSISITASHLPSIWNGFKLFTPIHPVNIGSEGIERIIDLLSDSRWDSITPKLLPSRNSVDFLPVYAEFLKSTIKKLTNNQVLPLQGLKVVVNAGNGAGGFLAKALNDLGADTSSSLHLEPDGTFPNHIPNPENKDAISATANAVSFSQSDLGICLDCDADRVGLVDGKSGVILNRNNLIALVSKIALSSHQNNSLNDNDNYYNTIVTDSATSNSLTRYIIDNLKGNHFRYKKGYRYVIEKARSIPDSVLAIECSGHGAWRENGWVDDGCYTAVRVLSTYVNSKTSSHYSISSLISDYKDPIESTEFRLKILSNNNRLEVINKTIDIFTNLTIERSNEGWSVEPNNYDGIRVNFMNGSGWAMLRSSLHEPILSLHVESEIPGGITNICKSLIREDSKYSLLHVQSEVNIDSIINYIRK